MFFIPEVQWAAAQEGRQWFNDKYEVGLELKGFRYIFPNTVNLYGVYFPDKYQDTLIYAEKLEFSFTGYSKSSNYLGSGNIELEGLKFHWLKYEGDTASNFQRFIHKFDSDKPRQNRPPFNMEVSNILIKESLFHYENANCDSCSRFYLDKLNLNVKGFNLEGEYVRGRVEGLSFKDKFGLEVKEFEADAAYLAHGIEASNMTLITALSEIQGDFQLNYETKEAFKDFVNQVDMQADFEYGMVNSSDVQYFASAFPSFRTFSIKGQISGPVNNMEAKNLNLRLGEATSIVADLELKNVTEGQSLYLNTPNLNLQTKPADIRFVNSLFSEKELPEIVDRLGAISVTGAYQGYLTSFRANGKVKTDIALLETAVLLENLNDPQKIKYDGNLNVEYLELGEITQNPQLGNLQAKLKLKGRGLDPENMNTSISGSVQAFAFKGYEYQNMRINGQIADGDFNGSFNIDDPNVNLDFLGKASFGSDTSSYDFVAKIDSADLYKLNLVKDTISTFSGEMNIDFVAIDYDRWTGEIEISNIAYENSRSSYFFKDLLVRSNGLEDPKNLMVESNILDARLTGNYTFGGLRSAFTNTFSKFNTFANADSLTSVDENFQFDITLKNPGLITEVFLPKLHIEPATNISGNFASTGQELDLAVTSGGIRYGGDVFQGIDLELSSGVERSQLDFTINRLSLASGYNIDSVKLDNYYERDTLHYNFSWVLRDSIDSRTSLNGFALQRDTSSFLVGIDHSHFNIGTKEFAIATGGRIFLDSSRVFIEDLIVSNGPEKIFINGAISDRENEILRVNMRGFGVELVNYFLGSSQSRFEGSLQGDLIISQILASPKFVADLSLDSLRLNRKLLGNLTLQSDYSLDNDSIKLDAHLDLGKLQTFSARGYYQADSNGAINLDVDFERFQLAALNPIVAVVANNLRGMLEGSLKVRGTRRDPSVNGRLNLPKVAFTIAFLQTDYNLTDNPYLEITNNAIKFPALQLRDTKFGTRGTLNGEITHKQFQDFNLDLRLNTNELLVLNTGVGSEDAYYGTAFATGVLNIKGPPDELNVSAQVQSERNTFFSIPIGGATEVKRSGFVTFVDPREKADSLEILNKQFDLDKGISLDFDIEVDQDAQVNIILNQSTGNKLSATGEGQIKLKLNATSDMQLFGTYTVAKGEYRFNLEGLFNKNFKVQRGGTVNWNGDPFSARLDITALYTTKADPSPFIGEISSGTTLTEVYLNITGPLTDPDISFEIKTPRANSTVQAVLSNRLADAEARNQQVFSLLALNTFTPQSNFLAGTGSGLNEWDILANQAASFLNRFTGDYEVSFDYQETAADGQDPAQAGTNNSELEVGLSKDFFNERLTISSSVGVPLNNNQNSIAGDFEVIYSLTEDGRLRAKAFNRSVDQQFNISLGQQQLYQQGVGIDYQVDFNDFGSLFRPKKSKGRKEEEPKEKKEE